MVYVFFMTFRASTFVCIYILYKDIETLQKQLEEVKHDICKKENEMKLKDVEIKTLALNMEKKIASLENRLQSLEENLEQVRNENQMLKAQVMAQEIDVEEIDREAQEKIDSEVEIDSEETIEAFQESEENYVEQNNPFKCKKCDFTGNPDLQAGICFGV
jgi:septal ring factor EnvC (AmiA/AmiB activator)